MLCVFVNYCIINSATYHVSFVIYYTLKSKMLNSHLEGLWSDHFCMLYLTFYPVFMLLDPAG